LYLSVIADGLALGNSKEQNDHGNQTLRGGGIASQESRRTNE